MKNSQQLKLGTEVDIDGMLVNEKKENILNTKKVLLFNLSIFSILDYLHFLLEGYTAESC